MFRAVVFFGLIAAALGSEKLDVLVNAAASFSATIQQQLEMLQSDPSPAELAEKTIDYAEAETAYFNALLAEMPELMKIATGKEARPLSWTAGGPGGPGHRALPEQTSGIPGGSGRALEVRLYDPNPKSFIASRASESSGFVIGNFLIFQSKAAGSDIFFFTFILFTFLEAIKDRHQIFDLPVPLLGPYSFKFFASRV